MPARTGKVGADRIRTGVSALSALCGLLLLLPTVGNAQPNPVPHPSAKGKLGSRVAYSYYDVEKYSGVALECFVPAHAKRYCVLATDLWRSK